MDIDELLPWLLLIILLAFGIWFFRKRRKSEQQRSKDNRRVLEALNLVEQDVKEKSLHILKSPESDEESALDGLKSLVQYYPPGISEDVSAIEKLLHELSEQMEEFGEQSAQTTLQSTILTNKNIKVADKLFVLIESVRAKLR